MYNTSAVTEWLQNRSCRHNIITTEIYGLRYERTRRIYDTKSYPFFVVFPYGRKQPPTPLPPLPTQDITINDVSRSPLEIRRRSHLYIILLYYTLLLLFTCVPVFLCTRSSSLYMPTTWQEWSPPFMLTMAKRYKTAHDYFNLSDILKNIFIFILWILPRRH